MQRLGKGPTTRVVRDAAGTTATHGGLRTPYSRGSGPSGGLRRRTTFALLLTSLLVAVVLLAAAPLAAARPLSSATDAATTATGRSAGQGVTRSIVTGDTHHWRGGGADNNWSTGGNWSPATAPSTRDTVVFDSDAASKTASNDLGGLSLAGISILGTGYSITGQAVTLTGAMSCTGSCAWGPDVILNTTQQISVGDGASLTISGKVGPFLDPTPAPGFTKVGAGSLTLTGTSSFLGLISVTAGTLVIDGTVASKERVMVAAGATLRGSGTVSNSGVSSTDFLDLSGALDPGDPSVGTLTTGGQTWESGGSFTVRMDSAGGSAGASPGWSKLACSGGVAVTATQAGPFTIKLVGAPDDFERGGSYHWLIASAPGALSGFDPANFTVDTSSFTPRENSPTGDFWVNSDASGVYLDYGHGHLTHTWSGLGADDDWSTAANWAEHAAPSSGDSLVFPAHETTETANNDLVAVFPATAVTIAGVTIADDAYVITGNAIVLGGSMTRSGGEGTSSWSPAILLNAAQQFDVEEGTLAVSGGINPAVLPSTGFSLEKTGAGTLALSGACLFGSVTASAGTLLVNGPLDYYGNVSVAAAATLGGAGSISYKGLHTGEITVSGTLAPGDAGKVGTLTTGDEAWSGSPTLEVHMDAAGGTQGSSPGWSFLMIGYRLQYVSPVNLSVKLVSIGDVSDFDPAQSYTWDVASCLEIGTGFYVSVDTSRFTPARTPTGTFSAIASAVGRIYITYTPPPTLTHHWTGLGADTKWSTGANWLEGSAPENGDSIVFPAHETTQTATNDMSSLSLSGVTIADGRYVITGRVDSINITGPLVRSGGSGSSSFGAALACGFSGGTLQIDEPLVLTEGVQFGNATKTGSGRLTLSDTCYASIFTLAAGSLCESDGSGVSGVLNVRSGTTLCGFGAAQSRANIAGTLAPGTPEAIGAYRGSEQTWQPGGTYAVRMDSAAGTMGVDWDHFSISNAFSMMATEAAPFTVELLSKGTVEDFDPAKSYKWEVAYLNRGIAGGYDATNLALDTSGFTPEHAATGSFALSAVTNENFSAQLYVEYTPPPTPTHHWSGLGADTKWSTGANWLEGSAPQSGDSVVFPAHETTQTATVDISNLSLSGVTIADGRYTIDGYVETFSLAGPLVRSGGSGSSTWSTFTTLATGAGTLQIDDALVIGARMGSSVPITKTGAGRLTIPYSGQLSSRGDLTIAAGSIYVDQGSLSATSGIIDVRPGATLGGSGSSSDDRVSGTLAPGTPEAIGSFSCPNQTWEPDGIYAVRMGSAAGTAGVGWDYLSISNALFVTATQAEPFTVKLLSKGAVADFDPAKSYTWEVAYLNRGFSGGFDATKLAVDASGFTPDHPATGSFALSAADTPSPGVMLLRVEYTPPFFKAAPVVGGGTASVAVGTKQHVTWQTTAPVGSGSFDLVAVDGASVETTIVAGVPADGGDSYAADWTVLQKVGAGWTLKAVHHGAGGDRVSPTSASFRIVNPALVISAPADGSTWSQGTTQTVSWTVSPAVTTGSFRLWATPSAGGTTRGLSASLVPVVPGQASYDLGCKWLLPAGSWKLSVYYYAAGTTFTCQNTVRPAVTVPLRYTITSSTGTGGTISPLGPTYVAAGGSQGYTVAASAGYHIRDVLVDSASVGATSTWPFTNVTADHTIAASFEKNPAITITAPADGSSWSRGTTQTVSWTLSPALSVGSFRVWATPAAGGTTRAVSTTVVPVVPAQSAYSLDCKWALPAGDWKLSIYYYAVGTTFTCQNAVKPVVHVP